MLCYSSCEGFLTTVIDACTHAVPWHFRVLDNLVAATIGFSRWLHILERWVGYLLWYWVILKFEDTIKAQVANDPSCCTAMNINIKAQDKKLFLVCLENDECQSFLLFFVGCTILRREYLILFLLLLKPNQLKNLKPEYSTQYSQYFVTSWNVRNNWQ